MVSKVEAIVPEGKIFKVETTAGDIYSTKTVLIAIGRRGTPRKLNVKGEDTEKVAYRLLEPEEIKNKNILVVGGGDSAIESALLLADENNVTLSYRSESFSRLKVRNADSIAEAIKDKRVTVLFNSKILAIDPDTVSYSMNDSTEVLKIKNDQVYIFAGGELPTQFLKKIGIDVTTKFGESILKH